MNTPNGKKVSIALEELGVTYEPHLVNIGEGQQHTPAFRSVNPNGKIPALIDPSGVDGRSITLMESGAILWYLGQKFGRLVPVDARQRSECLQWIFFQVGHIGPMLGQFGHFHRFARRKCPHPYPLERYRSETVRLLDVLEERLRQCEYLVGGSYSMADIATFPWIVALLDFYHAGDLVGIAERPHVLRWVETCERRPAARRGSKVCAPPRLDAEVMGE
jgi:GST-like protein